MTREKIQIRDEVNIAFKVKRELHDQLKEYCYLTGRTMRGLCINGLISSIKNLEKERDKRYKK